MKVPDSKFQVPSSKFEVGSEFNKFKRTLSWELNMQSDIQHILSLLKSTFEKNAWYGPSVKEVLNNITSEQATQRISNTHSIIELVAHMSAWRIYVVKMLEGELEYKVADELNFPTSISWAQALADLDESQEKLLGAIQRFDASLLYELIPNHSNEYTFYTLLHGIIQHDTYHTGQIMLIKKSN